jgi:D-glycero-D-manno-heptose 1,7-bisphosphate phosphatase
MTNKALFLDRDGIINEDVEYLYKIEDFKFVDHIFEVCSFFIERSFIIIVYTNQSGIARGFYSEKDFFILNEWMIQRFKDHNIPIAGVYFCPHHPELGIGSYRITCQCRKPAPGMILDARRDHNIDLSRSFLVGDRESDIEAGRNAGVGYNILIESRYVDATKKSSADMVAKSLKHLIDQLKLMNI